MVAAEELAAGAALVGLVAATATAVDAASVVTAVSVTTTAVAVTVETSVQDEGLQSPFALFHQLGWFQRFSRAASFSRGAGMATAEPATTAKTERALTETMFAVDWGFCFESEREGTSKIDRGRIVVRTGGGLT